jgi:hypothetical protein
MSDTDFAEVTDEVHLFDYENGRGHSLKNPQISRTGRTALSLTGECPKCGCRFELHGINNAKDFYLTLCGECALELRIQIFEYIDSDLLRGNTVQWTKNHKIGIWATNYPTVYFLMRYVPEFGGDNVYLINSNAGNSEWTTQIFGKAVHTPDIIRTADIDTIINVNSPKVFAQIERICSTDYPTVKRAVHIAELIA